MKIEKPAGNWHLKLSASPLTSRRDSLMAGAAMTMKNQE